MKFVPLRSLLSTPSASGGVNSKALKLTVPERSVPPDGHGFGQRYPDRHHDKKSRREIGHLKIFRTPDAFLVLLHTLP